MGNINYCKNAELCPEDKTILEPIIITLKKNYFIKNPPSKEPIEANQIIFDECYCPTCNKFLDSKTNKMEKLENVVLKELFKEKPYTIKDINKINSFDKTKIIYFEKSKK